MKNLLVPELRELLAEGDAVKMREFCEATHPALIADFLNQRNAAEKTVAGTLPTERVTQLERHTNDVGSSQFYRIEFGGIVEILVLQTG